MLHLVEKHVLETRSDLVPLLVRQIIAHRRPDASEQKLDSGFIRKSDAFRRFLALIIFNVRRTRKRVTLTKILYHQLNIILRIKLSLADAVPKCTPLHRSEEWIFFVLDVL